MSIPMRPTGSPAGQQPDDIIGNRVYAAWGVGDDGVLTDSGPEEAAAAA